MQLGRHNLVVTYEHEGHWVWLPTHNRSGNGSRNTLFAPNPSFIDGFSPLFALEGKLCIASLSPQYTLSVCTYSHTYRYRYAPMRLFIRHDEWPYKKFDYWLPHRAQVPYVFSGSTISTLFGGHSTQWYGSLSTHFPTKQFEAQSAMSWIKWSFCANNICSSNLTHRHTCQVSYCQDSIPKPFLQSKLHRAQNAVRPWRELVAARRKDLCIDRCVGHRNALFCSSLSIGCTFQMFR